MTTNNENNIVKFYKKGAAIDADAVLEQAVGNYNEIVILGWDKDGYLDLRVTSGTTIPGLLWLLELTKAKLINGDFSDE